MNIDKPVSYIEPLDSVESVLNRIVDEIVDNTDVRTDVKDEVLKTYDRKVLEEVTPR